MIYSFRYRHQRFSVVDGHVEAETLLEATRKAERWCAALPGRVFIPGSVQKWLIEVPEEQPAAEAVEDVTHKPSVSEQKAALKARGAVRHVEPGGGAAASGRIGA